MNKRLPAWILCAALLTASFASCGDTSSTAGKETAKETAGETTIPTEETKETDKTTYSYPLDDYGGYTFTYLNEDKTDWASCDIAPEEQNGDAINDALFNRKVAVEDALNIKIKEEKVAGDNLVSMTKKLVTAGDNTYDVISNRNSEVGGLVTGGYLTDMKQIDTIHFDQPWWDRIVVDGSTLDGKLYFASSDISLFAFEATWVMYFNESLFSKYDLEFPYQLVKDGKWTLDALYQIVKDGTIINDSTKYNPDGNNIYGLVSHDQLMSSLLTGAGESCIQIDDTGKPVISDFGDHFYSTVDKICAITGTSGQYIDRGKVTFVNTGNSVSLEFMHGSFLMAAETLGHIANLRNYDESFGILPIPKYDENQESYRSMIATWGVEMTTIPATNTELKRTGMILDYLAYQSYISLMEPYYNYYLTQKGARNEDSAEMLSIIRSTRTLDIGYLFGWSSSLEVALQGKLCTGQNDVSSTVAKLVPKIQSAIDKTMTAIAQN